MQLNLSSITPFEIYVILVLRLIGFIMLLVVEWKVIQEFIHGKGVRTTRLLLLILITSLILGSLLPFLQGICYTTDGCFKTSQIIPLAIVTAANNILASLTLIVIYFTHERT